MRILGLVTLRLVSFFRRKRFDLCNQVSISIHLDRISSALHSFSGITKLADHLACMAVAMSTAVNKFTAASIYAMENKHLAHNCSGLDFDTRAFFYYLEVAPAFVVRRLYGLVCGTTLSPCNAPCCHFVFNLQSHAVCYLALVSLWVCDLLYSCSTVLCRSVIKVVPCVGSATLSHVCWVFLRIVACCGAGLLDRSCYSKVVRRIVACVLFHVVLFHTLPCHHRRLVRQQEQRFVLCQMRTSQRCNIVPHKCLQLFVTSRINAASERCLMSVLASQHYKRSWKEGCTYVSLA